MIPSASVVSLQAYGYNPNTPLLPVMLIHTSYIVVSISVLSLVFSFRKPLFSGILGRTQCGTCNSTLSVINYVCHSLCNDLLLIIFAVGSRKIIIIKRRFFSRLIAISFFELPSLAGGFIKQRKRSPSELLEGA